MAYNARMSCPSCIVALSGTDGFDPSPSKNTAIGAVIGAAAGFLLAGRRYRWAGLAAGAAAGYLLAPTVAERLAKAPASPAAAPAAPTTATMLPPGGRPPAAKLAQSIRIMPATALQPPPEITQQTETDAFLDEWMQGPDSGPLQY